MISNDLIKLNNPLLKQIQQKKSLKIQNKIIIVMNHLMKIKVTSIVQKWRKSLEISTPLSSLINYQLEKEAPLFRVLVYIVNIYPKKLDEALYLTQLGDKRLKNF